MDKTQIKNDPSLIDYLYVLVKWRKLIVLNFLIVLVIAAGISLIIPKWYRAESTILPPAKEGEAFGLSSIMSKIPLGGLGLGAISEETSRFLAILNSRTLLESTAKQFDLTTRYKAKNMEETVKALREHIRFEVNEDGTIYISADAGTPYFATKGHDDEARALSKDMTNYVVQEMDRLNKSLKIEKASNTRIFIEQRYLQNLEDLKRAEEDFRAFQETNGTIAMPEQTTATITAAAEIKGQMIAKEIEIEILETNFSHSHSQILKAQKELRALESQYINIQAGSQNAGVDSPAEQDLFLPLNDVPNLGMQYARLFRDIKIQEAILEFLLPQYEQAKIQEAKDTPTVQVLDDAVLPVLRAKPKRALIVILAGFLSIVLSMLVALAIEHTNNLRVTDNESFQKLEKIKNIIYNDFPRSKKKYK